jgi:hypothetical protein
MSPAGTLAIPRAQDVRSDAKTLTENRVSLDTYHFDCARFKVNLRRDSLVNRLGIDFARASENATASGVNGSTDGRVENTLVGLGARFAEADLLWAQASCVTSL